MNPHISAQLVTEHQRQLAELAARNRGWHRATSRRRLPALARRGRAESDPTLAVCCA